MLSTRNVALCEGSLAVVQVAERGTAVQDAEVGQFGG
jgi:hypothetical protein